LAVSKKTACNIASVISDYNQLQIAISLESTMAKLIMWSLMTLNGFAVILRYVPTK
jgi:hypothetical protein